MAFNAKNEYVEHYPDYSTDNEFGSIDTRHRHDYHSSSFEQQSQGSYTGHYRGESLAWQQEDGFHGAASMNGELVPDYEPENISFASHGNRFAQFDDSYSDDDDISSRGQRLHSENLQKERSPDERVSRSRTPEDRFPRGRSPERFPRGRSPEDRFPRGRSPEDRFPRGRSPDDRFQRGRSPEDKFQRKGSLEDGFSRDKLHDKMVAKEKAPKERYNDHDAISEYDESQETMESPWFNDGHHEMSRSLVTKSQEGDRQEIMYEEIDNPGFVGTEDADFQTEQEILEVNYRSNSNNFDFSDGTQTKIFRRKSKKFLKSVQGNDDISLLDGADDYDYLPSHQQKEKQPLREKMTLLREQKSLHGVVSVYRDQIVRVPVTEASRLKAWHHRQKQSWQRFKLQAKSWIYQLEPWSGALKEVEGHFGTSIMGYFRFVRWLMFLNLYICLVNICLTLVPYFALYESPSNFTSSLIGLNTTFFQAEAADCTLGYKEELDERSAGTDVLSNVLHFLQGTGWMEDTVLFYGAFFNKTYHSPIHDERKTYNMGLSYLLATGVSFIISFFVIVKNSSKGLKDTAVIHGATMATYSNKVLSGWDFCISQAKAAKTKHSNISGELKKDLEIERFMWKMENRTTGDKIKLYLLRTVINILMVFLLGVSLYLIYLSFSQLLVLQEQFKDTTPALVFVIQYLPSVTITLLNIIVPVVFKKVVVLEDYTPSFEMIMTLLRTILLRLSSLGVLLISIYQLLQSDDPQYENMCGNKKWSSSLASNTSTNASSAGSIIKCWETYVGQQIYKLVILDFLVLIIVTFIVELPRRLVYNTFSKRLKLIDMVGLPEVDLPKVVLDIVYAQTLCWMGLFFSPLIPFMCFLKCFIVFYVKKFTLLNNYVAPTRPYRTTRSNSLFIGMLFISFLMAAIPITYMVGNFNPSQSCGPFRVYSTNHTVFFDTVAHVILEWPQEAQDVFFFLGNTSFFIPAILVMCLLMYYYWAVKEGLTKMEKMLQEQLKLEGRDKQFLLARVNEIVQHMDTGGANNG